MFIRRWFLAAFGMMLVANALQAQTVNLIEAPLDKQCVRHELTMQLEGKITVSEEGKERSFPHKASAKHVYDERYLETNANVAEKAARYYASAESTIHFNNDMADKRTLRDKCRFIVAQRVSNRVLTYNPETLLQREEAELLEHFDTMSVSGLLPGKEIAVGKTWNVPNHVTAALCDLEALTLQNLEGKLESVEGKLAQLTIIGKAQGINLGAQVSILVNAKLTFDTKEQRIVNLEWKETDDRKQGPITPTLMAEVTLKLTRSAIDTPDTLKDFALVKVPTGKTPPVEMTNVLHLDAKKQYTLGYSRDWHVVSPETSTQLVLRNLEQSLFIAQATITPWKKIEPKNVISIADFAAEMAKTPGWREDKETDRTELKNLSKGQHAVYRVVASGSLDGVQTTQFFYLIVGVNGQQALVTFSVDPQQVRTFGARDVELVREFVFLVP
jgi:hypothetical protein